MVTTTLDIQSHKIEAHRFTIEQVIDNLWKKKKTHLKKCDTSTVKCKLKTKNHATEKQPSANKKCFRVSFTGL